MEHGLPSPGSGQRAVQGRSLPGLRTAQMRVIRSPATSKANTDTVTKTRVVRESINDIAVHRSLRVLIEAASTRDC